MKHLQVAMSFQAEKEKPEAKKVRQPHCPDGIKCLALTSEGGCSNYHLKNQIICKNDGTCTYNPCHFRHLKQKATTSAPDATAAAPADKGKECPQQKQPRALPSPAHKQKNSRFPPVPSLDHITIPPGFMLVLRLIDNEWSITIEQKKRGQ